MKTIALVSIKGGTGRTALTAHLGTAFAGEQRVVLLDADPQNGLGHYLGMLPGERFGLSQRGITTADLIDFVRRARPEVPYLPFGALSLADLEVIEAELAADPYWLRDRIEQLAQAEFDLVIIDTPAGHSEWTRQALRAADMALVVLEADPGSYATVPATRELLERCTDPELGFAGSYWLLNRMDPRSPLSRDVKSALANLLPDELLPVSIPYDEAVREVLGHQQTLLRRFPDSQVLSSLRDVADFLKVRLEKAPVARKTRAEIIRIR
jgi:cellulose synthase operon protein YhjQ